MRIFYSELCLIGGSPEKNADLLIENGAENIELMLDGAGWNGFHTRMAEIARTLAGRGVGYSVHVPVWDANLTAENAYLRSATLETYRMSIEFAELVKARHVVLHTGYCGDVHFDKAEARKRASGALRSLLEFAKDRGQLLLVENVGTVSKSIFTQPEFSAFLNDFPDGIGYIVDIGHAHINGWDFGSLFPEIRDRLYALHIHDNDGTSDAHGHIGEGTVPWEGLFDTIRRTGRDLNLVLEYNIGTDLKKLKEGKTILEKAFSGQERLSR